MRFLPDEPYRRTVYIVFYSVLGIMVVYVAAKYIFPILLPFLIAFGAAALLRRPSAALAARLRLSQKVTSVVLVLVVLTGLIALVSVIAAEAVSQLSALAKRLVGQQDEILSGLSALLDKVGAFLAKMPLFPGDDADSMRESIGTAFSELVKNTLVSFVSRLPGIVGRLVSAVPQALIFSVMTVLAAIYFCADYEKILRWIKSHLKGRPLAAVREMYGQTGRTLVRYLKSYAVLFFLTFAELFVGFTVLKIDYAFLIALVTAIVDILPILGTGTVLIPWAVCLFLVGNTRAAVGLLILYAVISLVRQIVEPRIIGAGIGLHPLAALVSMYVGLRMFGVFGMLAMPIAVVIVSNTVRAFRRPEKGRTNP